MKKYHVARPYRAAYPYAVSFTKGERASFERKPTEWPGWLWCTNDRKESAWVPEAWTRLDGPVCIIMRDYSSRELTVEVGDELSLIEQESGWVLCKDKNGETGWVPLQHVEEV